MKALSIAFLTSLLFGLGLGVSGMTDPKNVIGFLDVTGSWNPSLAFVMVGAISVHAVAYRLITRRNNPVLSPVFHIPKRRDIDWKLILGAVLFGVGWGIGGYCPGPALVSVVSGHSATVTFVVSMVFGIFLFSYVDKRLSKKQN